MKRLEIVLAAPPAPDGAPGAGFSPRSGTRAPGPEATAIVLDVLRASTTLTVALENGAASVIAAGTVSEALQLRRERPEALLCGERDGRIVPGFDLGNSPFEYVRERVAGRTLVFASTNGSQALKLAARARVRLVAGFVNAAAAIERAGAASEVWLIAAGKLGEVALEDLACAGWIARALSGRGYAAVSREARLALAAAPADRNAVRALVQSSQQGRHLRSLGAPYVRDVERCAELDSIASVFAV